MAQKEVDKYTERLALLARGKLTEAAAVTTGGGKAAESAKTFVEAGEGENVSEKGDMLKGKTAGKAKGAAPRSPLDGKLRGSLVLCTMHVDKVVSVDEMMAL